MQQGHQRCERKHLELLPKFSGGNACFEYPRVIGMTHMSYSRATGPRAMGTGCHGPQGSASCTSSLQLFAKLLCVCTEHVRD